MKTLFERFWEKVEIDSGDKCWLWCSQKDKNGYGLFRFNGKHAFAHRVAYELTHGVSIGEKCCLHHCDVPACVNPSHLFLGSQADNLRDMQKKGRQVSGEQHGNHKLTDKDVDEIMSSPHVKGIDLATKYGVSPAHISNIRHGHRRVVDGCKTKGYYGEESTRVQHRENRPAVGRTVSGG